MISASSEPSVAVSVASRKVFHSAGRVEESSKKVKWKLCSVMVSGLTICEATREKAELNSAT